MGFFSRLFGGGSKQSSKNYSTNPSGEYFYKENGRDMYYAPWLQQPIAQPTSNLSVSDYPKSQQHLMNAAGVKPKPLAPKPQKQITITGGTGPAPVYHNPPPAPAPAPAPVPAPAPAPAAAAPVQSVNDQLANERERRARQRERQENRATRKSERLDAQYLSGLQNKLDTLGSRLGSYTINDLASINSAQRQLDLLSNQANSYRSDTSDGLSLMGVDDYRSILDDLLTERASEANRFKRFSRGIGNDLSEYSDYTVNSDLDAAEAALRDMMMRAENYDTGLDVDLSSPMSRIQFAMDDINRLTQERSRQQGVIDQARESALDSLGGLGNLYTDVDYRDAQALDNIGRKLDGIINPNLGVDLDYDFSDLSAEVDPYRQRLETMRERRMRELNMLGDDISEIGNSLTGFYANEGLPTGDALEALEDAMEDAMNASPGMTISEFEDFRDRNPVGGGPINYPDLYYVRDGKDNPYQTAGDELFKLDRPLRDIESASEVYAIRDRLSEALNSLDAFGVGDRTNELSEQIFRQDEIYKRLSDQLLDRQSGIETDAQAQLDAFADARFSRPDDLASFEQALQDLTGQRDLFDASIASDELQRLTDQISSRRSDLERDEAARIAREELERRRAMQGAGGSNRFSNQFVSPEDYSAYLRALELGRKDDYFEDVGTGFSRALGLA